MRQAVSLLGLCVMLTLGISTMLTATEEVTMSGTIMCAKCSLKKEDAKECQDVLVVKDADGKATHYYITKNESAKEAGHTCSGEAAATVTGTVSEKDGKMWIAASKIVKTK
jgi:hypothetical protein